MAESIDDRQGEEGHLARERSPCVIVMLAGFEGFVDLEDEAGIEACSRAGLSERIEIAICFPDISTNHA